MSGRSRIHSDRENSAQSGGAQNELSILTTTILNWPTEPKTRIALTFRERSERTTWVLLRIRTLYSYCSAMLAVRNGLILEFRVLDFAPRNEM